MPSTTHKEAPISTNIILHSFLASTVIFLVAFVVILAFFIKKKLRSEADLENGLPEVETVTRGGAMVVSFSVENSFRERTILHDIQFDAEIAKGKYNYIPTFLTSAIGNHA